MSTAWPTPRSPGVAGGVALSAVLHVAGLAALFISKPSPTTLPAVARIEMIAAAAGAPAMGVVQETKTETTEPAPNASAAPIKSTKAADTKPKRRPPEAKHATANSKLTPPTKVENAPTAAGGPTGGKGTDVANVNTNGITFPYTGYLTNIVRQIRVNFTPPAGLADSASLSFRIMRDGSVEALAFVTRAPHNAFNREAFGAIEAVGAAKKFGPLPPEFKEDALFVIFTFDPQFYRK